ncbi:MAG: S41 family peptidase [Gammaproteobacteria bacterium]
MRNNLPLWLLLTWLLSGSQILAAAEAGSVRQRVAADSQEYFLLQAFHTRLPGSRLSIHHLGLLTEERDKSFYVSAVLDGFPAQQAGLRRGDRLDSIDGKPFQPVLSLNPSIGDGGIADPTPRQVRLTFTRNGADQSTSLRTVYGNLYDAFRSATGSSLQQFSNGNKVIGYIKLWTVNRSTDNLQSFRRMFESLAHCDGLIIDLRDSYGFIDAVHLDWFFASRNSYLVLEGDNPDLWRERQSERQSDDYYDRAMVVMQNHGTRGSMELLGYQLGKLQRVVSLGETTMGKAGQVTYNGGDGSIEYVTGDQITVDGILMESNGFPPEQSVAYPLTDSRASDPQFDAAMMTLMQIM